MFDRVKKTKKKKPKQNSPVVDQTRSVDFEPKGGGLDNRGGSSCPGLMGKLVLCNPLTSLPTTTPSFSHPLRHRQAPAPPPATSRQWLRSSGKSRTLGSRAWACRRGWSRRRWSRRWWPGATGRGLRPPAWFWNQWPPGWWGRFPPCSAGSATWRSQWGEVWSGQWSGF